MNKSSTAAIAAQKRYAGSYSGRQRLGLIVPEAFIRGIRHIGYKTNVEAIAELIDNSIQAYAERVDLVFGYVENGSNRKPIQLVVIDDGHGISPVMMRLALMMIGAVAAREGRPLADATRFDLDRAATRRECVSTRSPRFAQLQPERLGHGRFRDVANEPPVERESQLRVGKAFDKLGMRAD